MQKQKKLILLVLLVMPLTLYSLQNKFNFITTEDGLSQGNITCIYQDFKGFIWFGTFNGLNRYDGYSIKVYKHDLNDIYSLGNDYVKYLCEDKEHKLWIGTYGNGVSVFYPEEGKFRNINKVIVNNKEIQLRNMTGLICQENGDIWALEELQGLFVFDADLKLKKAYLPDASTPNALPATFCFALASDKNGSIWVGNGNGTLLKLNKEKESFESFVFESQKAKTADDGIRCIYIDKQGIFWIGTLSQGAYSFDPKTKSIKNYKLGPTEFDLGSNIVLSFYEDWDDNLLIGTDGGGLNSLDRQSGIIKKIKYDIGNQESLNSNNIYSLFIDRSETLWIGTYGGGVNYCGKYRNKFITYRPDPLNPKSLSFKKVKCFLQDSDGDIWIGTDGGGINKFDISTGNFEHFLADPNNKKWLQTNTIISMMQDSDDDIFIGSYSGGMTIFNKTTNKFKQYLHDENNPNSIAGNHPWYFLKDSYGILWVGLLSNGLDKFDKATGTFNHYKSDLDDPSTLNSPNIKVMYEDKSRHLWIGTDGGGLHLYNRDNDNFTRYFAQSDVKNSISNNDVRALYEDTKGRFWVGTGDGLNLMDRDKGVFEHISSDNGPAGNVINDILEDAEGNLWISTNFGISNYNYDNKTVRNYNNKDGLQGNEFNYTAALKTKQGYFFFGGNNGFNVFRPEEIIDNPNVPEIVLTDMQILNKSVNTIQYKNKDVTIPYLKEVILSQKQNIFGFEFSALDFGNPVKNKYRYKLEGFDKEWTDISSLKRSVTYTNLKAGKYVFRVIGSNSDSKWNNEGIAIKIKIKPPFWKRAWFLLLLIITVTIIIVRYIKSRQQRVIDEKLLLEEKIKKGLAEVEKQKLEVDIKDKELAAKIENEKVQNWQSIGMNKISKVISQNKDDLYKLSDNLILTFVEYLEVPQGAVILLNTDNENDLFLEVTASFAPEEKRNVGTRIEIEEGNIGASFKTKKLIKIDNLPDNYAKCSSGLGESVLRYLAVIPLKLDENVIGVIEILSFEKIDDYKINFIEKAGETLTSILSALKATEQTKKLLENQRLLTEQSAAQEEELRQNLEELQSTQEELQRQMETVNKAQAELTKEKRLIDTMLENAREKIYFKDSQSRFIKVSKSMAEGFKVKSVSDLMGKSDFDFFTEEHARPAFEDEMEIIKTGTPIVDKIEKETHSDGRITYVSTTKMPIYDENHKIVGTFGISKDVTEAIHMEQEMKQRNEELLAQEEELRQNLEEMQTVQENLQTQISENEKIQQELAKEKYLMDALMNSVPEFIYFKDNESKFIKNSKSHALAFGLNDPKQLIGKSDFDFFDDEHAKPAFKDEQKIIKTGKPLLNLIEKEVKKDGSVSYVSTTKLPLYDENNNIVGTFGISKDVTEAVQMEQEIKQRNEELLAQEEELRQNLEEMQTIQEDLEKQINENQKMQAALQKEKALLDAIMNNLPDYLYFKDIDSKFIRISKSMLPLFPVKTLEDMIGKSDFDFQPHDVAQKYYEDEMKIIKTGKAVVNNIAHEIMDTGVEQWVATTKLPFYDETGKCIGTFGISKNITEVKEHELSAQRISQELKAKELTLKKEIEQLKAEIGLKTKRINELEKGRK